MSILTQHRFALLLLLVAIGLVVLVEVLAPRPLDWTTSYALDDKKPFGSKILYERLPDIFPNQPVDVSYRTLYERKDSLRQGNYLFIGDSFSPGEEDIKLLLRLVSEGSHAFIAAGQLSDAFADTLNCSTRSFFFLSDTVTTTLTDRKLKAQPYQFRKVNLMFGFSPADSAKPVTFQILGVNEQKEPNFVRIPWGRGWFYLQCMPQAYTNYNVLAGRNREYIEKTLSYLPVQEVYWEEFYKGNVRELETPLRFLIVTPPLRWALYLSVIALLLFITFEAKRRQRIIPVIEPLANTTLGFTQTVSQLYYQYRDHKNIAEKRITYFLDYLRSHYYVSTQTFNDELYNLLHLKTGAPREEIAALFTLIRQVRAQPSITEEQLLELNRRIEGFTERRKRIGDE